ncbi:poly(A) RNA polymerase, mitochondrial-like [Littorina saxatilis]|uniref:Mitochondrial poly(A) polymerase n=1 Tax=Littorina saxatilis TaxID=31220 RepID=A0AAN9G3G5_9CAEN
MAMPLQRVLKTSRLSFGCVCTHTRFLASKRKDTERRKVDYLRVTSLFEKQKGKEDGKRQQATTYRAVLDDRHDQATRSVLIRVHHAPQDVCDSLQSLGPVNSAFILQKAKNYMLVEFANKATVEKLLKFVTYFPDEQQIPVRSRLLYHMQTSHVQRHKPGSSIFVQQYQNREVTAKDYINADSVSSQMEDLHSVHQLSDVGSRLRFFICSMVEDLVRSSLPFCRIDPFGSSSNGFGWEGCDLDMMMNLRPPWKQGDPGGKFRFLTKRGSGEERVFGQQCLDVVGEMVRVFMPSAYGVIKVLNARVPIIKFHHEATAIDCDLSYLNVSGTKMSELMYLLGEVDPRVRVVMTTVKQWAKSCDLTRSHPGPWPSSFTLLSMVIFFLQTRSPPVLPSLRNLQALAGPSDHFTIDDLDYAFVTDITQINKSTNTQSLDELLMEFFHYFAHFDFSAQALSLIEGSTYSKTFPCPMYIENPLDICHNVSKNVNGIYVSKLQAAMLEALRCLETRSVPTPHKEWGLFCLFNPQEGLASSRKYDVAGLFSDNRENGESERVVGKDEGTSVEEGLAFDVENAAQREHLCSAEASEEEMKSVEQRNDQHAVGVFGEITDALKGDKQVNRESLADERNETLVEEKSKSS